MQIIFQPRQTKTQNTSDTFANGIDDKWKKSVPGDCPMITVKQQLLPMVPLLH